MQLFDSVIENGEITAQTFFICLGAALLCGVFVAAAACIKSRTTKSFVISLILLPMIVNTIIAMVNGNIGTGVAVAGAFSLVRFRSVPGKAKDIAAIFLAMTSGLACAAGYVAIAIVSTLVICVILVLLSFIPMGTQSAMELRITVPESLRFANEFNDLLDEYTHNHRLVKVKTSDMGSLYVLLYTIQLKDTSKIQEFIDKIRCRNGNLEISIAEAADSTEEL